MTISSLAEAIATQPALEGPSLKSDHPFVLLNTAFFEDGVFHIAPKTVVTEPIEIVFTSAPGADPAMVTPRLLGVVGEQAQVSIVERYEGVGSAPVLTSAVSEFMLGPGTVVDHVKVQQESAEAFHMASTFVHLHRASTFTSRHHVRRADLAQRHHGHARGRRRRVHAERPVRRRPGHCEREGYGEYHKLFSGKK